MASGSETTSSDEIDFVVCNEPGAVRFDYEHPCGQEPAYSIWLWGSEDLTYFLPDGTEEDALTVAPQDLVTAAIIASGFGRVVGYRPIPLDQVALRNRAEVEHMLTQLAGDVYEPLRFKGGHRWWIIAESFVGVRNILQLPWMRTHRARELPGHRYVIAFDWDGEWSDSPSTAPSDGARSPAIRS